MTMPNQPSKKQTKDQPLREQLAVILAFKELSDLTSVNAWRKKLDRLENLFNERLVEELKGFSEWLGDDGVDVQTGKTNVDYYFEEKALQNKEDK